MNNLLKISSVIILLLLVNDVLGQSHYTVNPNNVTQVSLDILNDYDHLIDISDQDLKDHIQTIVKPSMYCTSCQHTAFEPVTTNQNNLKLKWPAIAGAVEYELRYINLENGNTELFTTAATNMTINDLPPAAYAFSIVTLFEINNSLMMAQGDIIILEMPILIDDAKENCQCKAKKTKNLPIDGGVVPWNPVSGKTYLLEFSFSDNSISRIILETYDSNHPNAPLLFLLTCAEQLSHPGQSNTLRSLPATGATIYLFYENDYFFQFFTTSAQLVQAKVSECSRPKQQPTTDIIERLENSSGLMLYPNPGHDLLTIDLGDDRKAKSVIIYNAFGSIVYKINNLESRQSMDVSSWPSGVYQVKIFSDHTQTIRTFIKNN